MTLFYIHSMSYNHRFLLKRKIIKNFVKKKSKIKLCCWNFFITSAFHVTFMRTRPLKVPLFIKALIAFEKTRIKLLTFNAILHLTSLLTGICYLIIDHFLLTFQANEFIFKLRIKFKPWLKSHNFPWYLLYKSRLRAVCYFWYTVFAIIVINEAFNAFNAFFNKFSENNIDASQYFIRILVVLFIFCHVIATLAI